LINLLEKFELDDTCSEKRPLPKYIINPLPRETRSRTFAAPGHLFSGVDSKIDDPIETDRTAEAEVSWLRAESQRKSKKMRLRCIFFDTQAPLKATSNTASSFPIPSENPADLFRRVFLFWGDHGGG